jgi:hypothetical protein
MRTVLTLAFFTFTSLAANATENFVTWSFDEAAKEFASAQPPADQALSTQWLQLGVATNDRKPAQYDQNGNLSDSRTGKAYKLVTTYNLRTEKTSQGLATFTRINSVTMSGKTINVPDNIAVSEISGVQTPVLSGKLCGPYQ